MIPNQCNEGKQDKDTVWPVLGFLLSHQDVSLLTHLGPVQVTQDGGALKHISTEAMGMVLLSGLF